MPAHAGHSGLILAADQSIGSTLELGTGGGGGSIVRRTVLPGGIRVLTETMPGVRSAAYGIWIGVGSRDETVDEAGCSHYLEHLLFKGTKTRGALAISSAIDAVGGEMNAFTGKEYTCFYARVLDADLPLAIDVVTDMVASSLIEPADVDSERGVILEEIAMHDDDPADCVHDEFATALWGDAPVGRPVLGTVESIEGLSREVIAAYYSGRYQPEQLVVAVAGNLDHDAVVAMVTKAFTNAGLIGGDAIPVRPRTQAQDDVPASSFEPIRLISRMTEQANLLLGGRAPHRTDERRYVLTVLNTALGGGMSSRLFQEIREKRGLAYSVYSYVSQYAGAGMFGVYAGCLPKKIDDVLAVSRDVLASVAADGLTEEEVARGKGQVRGSLVLGLEDPASRMMRIGKAELLYDSWLSVDEVLDRVAAVTPDDVHSLATEVFSAPLTLAVVGPFEQTRSFAA